MKNIDRWLGVICALLVLAIATMVFIDRNWSWSWILAVLLTISFGIWVLGGLKKLEVGWRGQLLCLGERQDYFVGEGWHWAPFPCNIKTVDCRQITQKLDHLEVITKDKVRVEIDGTIIRRILNLNLYFGVEESSIKQGLDDIWDEAIRTLVAKTDLADVLKMQIKLGKKVHKTMQKNASVDWGIEIQKVIVAGTKPDVQVSEDLALKEREELQREGQKVEIAHFALMVDLLVKGGVINGITIPGGLTQERAYEQVQIALGKATKTVDEKKITLDPATVAMFAAFFGRKP